MSSYDTDNLNFLGTETKVWLEKVIILGNGPNNNPARVITKVFILSINILEYIHNGPNTKI